MIYDLYDLAHVAGWEPYNPHDLAHCFLGLDLPYKADPAQPLTTADEELDHISLDRS